MAEDINDNGEVGIFVIICAVLILMGVIIGACMKVDKIESPKPLKPIVEINCKEIDGVRNCDTTYIYKQNRYEQQ